MAHMIHMMMRLSIIKLRTQICCGAHSYLCRPVFPPLPKYLLSS